MHFVAEPIVERLLATPSGFDVILYLGLMNQRLSLTALDSTSQKLPAQRNHIELRIRDPRSQRRGMTTRRARLLKTGQPVSQLPAVGAHPHLGTAFMSDVGMTGDYDSVIGMTKEEPLQRFTRKISSSRFEAASGPATLCGLAVETDPKSGLAARVGAGRLGGCLEPAVPAFWS